MVLAEGKVVGYMCFFNPWTGAFDTEDSLGTFSPLHANGAIVTEVLKLEGFEYIGVDFESYNPTANRIWAKHFNEYTNSVTRKIELWCKDY